MEYATLEARLKSFEPPTKRSKAGWPHKTPSADAIAAAGFYYRPNRTGDDNVVCYLCDRYLDGWEKDDDPVAEHLQHSSDCGFAIMAGIARKEAHDPSQMEDPTSQRLEDARRATFANWPHEEKRAWTCKIEKMVEAGWHFTPTYECEDFTSCAYCKLSLDGWEPKDNPFDEHYRRNPECQFFVFAGTTAPSKRPKAKKGRTSRSSKASTRLSTQSQVSTQDIPELDDSIDTSTTSVVSNMSRASTASKAKRKAAGGGRSTRAKKPKVSFQVDAEPEPEPERAESVIEVDDPIDQSTTSVASMMSTASTATAKGKKKAGGRTKKAPAKKTKATRTTRAKKAESEPEPEEPEPIVEPVPEPEEAEAQNQAELAQSHLEDAAATTPSIEVVQPEVEEVHIDEATPVQSPKLPEPAPRQEEAEIEYPMLQQAADGSPLQHKSSPYPHKPSPHLQAHSHTSPYPHKSSPQPQVHSHTSPMAGLPTPPSQSPSVNSPSNSDIENAPPSSLPASSRPPPAQASSSSPSPATSAWTPVDLELIFQKTPGGEVEHNFFDMAQTENLSEQEQNMTVQEWIEHIAAMAEQDLKQESERVVTVFEKEGARAMGVIEAVESS